MTEPTCGERVEFALDLLAHLGADRLSLTEVVNCIETVTTDPTLTRDILGAAELHGIIKREDDHTRHNRGNMFVRFEGQVVQREGDFDYRRCGASISTGYFVRFDSGKLRPFGSSCVRKALRWE